MCQHLIGRLISKDRYKTLQCVTIWLGVSSARTGIRCFNHMEISIAHPAAIIITLSVMVILAWYADCYSAVTVDLREIVAVTVDQLEDCRSHSQSVGRSRHHSRSVGRSRQSHSISEEIAAVTVDERRDRGSYSRSMWRSQQSQSMRGEIAAVTVVEWGEVCVRGFRFRSVLEDNHSIIFMITMKTIWANGLNWGKLVCFTNETNW